MYVPSWPNLHDGDSREFVSVQNRVKNRRRSTPPRQKTRVHVEDPTEIKTRSGGDHRKIIKRRTEGNKPLLLSHIH